MARAVVLALLLLAVSVSAAEANRQTTTWSAEADISATSMAAKEPWFLMGTPDPTATLGEDVDPRINTWFLWNEATPFGQAPRWQQDGTSYADPADCQTVPGVTTNCVGNIVALDLAWKSDGLDGIAFVVAANDEDGEGYIQYYTSEGFLQSRVDFAGETVNDVAISPDGRYVVVGTTVQPESTLLGDDPTGLVRMYAFNTDAPLWTRGDENTQPVTDLAFDLADDGSSGRILAAAGDLVLGYDLDGTTFADNLGSNPKAAFVAVSHTLDQWGVAGFTEGHVTLYHTPDGEVYKRKGHDSPDNDDITAIAMTADGRFYAAGDESGSLRLYNNKFIDLGSPGLLETSTFPSAVTDLAFSHNGRYLVASGGPEIHFYQVSKSGLTPYWSDAFGQDTVSHVEVAGDGGTVLAVVGDTVYRYEPIEDVAATGPADALPIEPAGQEEATLSFHNKGNRDVDYTLSAEAPEGWGVQFDPKTFSLVPGEQQNVKVTVAAATGHAAGPETLTVVATSPTDSKRVEVPISVLQDRLWRVESNGTLNVGVDAGGAAFLTVRVTNDGNAVDETTVTAVADKETWAIAAQPAKVRLEPGETTEVRIQVQAPADAKELETATITVSTLAVPEVTVTLTATVGANFGLTFTGSLEGPLFPDARANFDLTVANTGNAPDSIQIETEGLPKGWKLTYPDGNHPYTVFNLQPGASTTIPMTVQVDDDADLANYQFRLRATSLGDTSQSQVVTITVGVEEAPVETPKDNESPGPGALVLVGLLGLAAARRFRP